MQDDHHILHGACSCGRNRYTVALPDQAISSAQVLFDTSSASRRAHASPWKAYLLIPLPWYASATYAQYSDETHASIRRVFHSSPSPISTSRPQISGTSSNTSKTPTPTQQRHFCGFCGTHFSSWEEKPREPTGNSGASEAEQAGPGSESDIDGRISVVVESLLENAIERLAELGLWPSSEASKDEDEDDDDSQSATADAANSGATASTSSTTSKNALARGKPRDTPRGRHTLGGAEGMWEVVELEGGEVLEYRNHRGDAGGGKRKIEDVEGAVVDWDAEMR